MTRKVGRAAVKLGHAEVFMVFHQSVAAVRVDVDLPPHSTTVEPAGRFSVESVRPSTPQFQSSASRRRCGFASPVSSCSTSKCVQVFVV